MVTFCLQSLTFCLLFILVLRYLLGSGSKKLLNTDPIWIRIPTTHWLYYCRCWPCRTLWSTAPERNGCTTTSSTFWVMPAREGAASQAASLSLNSALCRTSVAEPEPVKNDQLRNTPTFFSAGVVIFYSASDLALASNKRKQLLITP